MPVSIQVALYIYHTLLFRLCNSICKTRQWSPELNPEKLAVLEAKALQDIQIMKADAQELKFLTYPSSRPQDWQPAHNEIDADDCDDDDNLSGIPTETQTLAHHMLMAQSGTNPPMEALFGKSVVERIRLKSDLLAKRKPGRPKKSEKSSSGALGPGGLLSQQLNGSALPKFVKGPSKAALKGVQQRTGGLVNFGTLVQSNNIPGRILVSFLIHHIKNLLQFSQKKMLLR